MLADNHNRDLLKFAKEHQSAEIVKPLKELSLIKDSSVHYFTLFIDLVSNPFVANPTEPIGTRIKVPIESLRPRIMPRCERCIYQIGMCDSFSFVNPDPLDTEYYPLPMYIRFLNFGGRTEYDFAIFPGVGNNTSQAIKSSMDLPNTDFELEYGKSQGALPDTIPVGSFVYTKGGDIQGEVGSDTTALKGLDPLLDYNRAFPLRRPSQYLISLQARFYLKTTTLI